MKTITLECGCSFTFSMFGEDELIDFHLCDKHIKEFRNMIQFIFISITKDDAKA